MKRACSFGAFLFLILVISSAIAKKDTTKQKFACSKGVANALVDRFTSTCIFPDDHLLGVLYPNVKDCGQGKGGMYKVTEALLKSTQSNSKLDKYIKKIEKYMSKAFKDLTYDDMDYPEYSYLVWRAYVESEKSVLPLSTKDQYSFIASLPNTQALDLATFTSIKDSITSDCKTQKVDIVFLVDGSGSVGSAAFTQSLNFVSKVVDSLKFKNNGKGARVGMVTYSTDVAVNFELDEYKTKNDVKDAISNVRYPKGVTRTDRALSTGLEMLRKHQRGRAVAKMMVLLTDGKSTEERLTEDAADAVRNSDIGPKVYVVGIGGGVVKAELDYIASTPKCTHTFELTGYADAESFVPQLQLETCKATSRAGIGESIEGALELGEVVNFDYEVQAIDIQVDGTFKFELTVGEGEVQAYVSNYPGPSEEVFDLSLTASAGSGGVIGYVAVNTQAYARRRRRDTSPDTYKLYISLTGKQATNAFSVKGSAPPGVRPSLLAMAACLLFMFTKL